MKTRTKDTLKFYGRNGALLVAGLLGSATGILLSSGCESTLGDVSVHHRPCAAFSSTGDKLGDIAAAQTYSDDHRHVTDTVCYIDSEDGSREWYISGGR